MQIQIDGRLYNAGAVNDSIDERDHAFAAVAPFPWEIGFDIELLLGYRQTCKDADEFFGWRKRAGWGLERWKEIIKECKDKSVAPFIIKPSDQGQSYSCTGQGLAKYLSILNMIETGEWVDISARDIYAYISLGAKKGAMLRDAIVLAIDRGIGTEKLVPSYIYSPQGGREPMTETQMMEKPIETPELVAIRTALESAEYQSIVATSTERREAMAWATLMGFGCYFGVRGQNNGTWGSEWPQPPIEDEWGHALYAGKVEMVAGQKVIEHINSWGNVGLRGWQKLGDAYFSATSMIFNPWTLTDKPNNDMAENTFVKIIKDKNGPGVGYWIPAVSPDALKTMAAAFNKEVKVKADGTIDWDATIEGELTLK